MKPIILGKQLLAVYVANFFLTTLVYGEHKVMLYNWGSLVKPETREMIHSALAANKTSLIIEALTQGKKELAYQHHLGSPERSFSYIPLTNKGGPLPADLIASQFERDVRRLLSHGVNLTCPRIGREFGKLGLALLYARTAGVDIPLKWLEIIARNLMAQQYSEAVTSRPLAARPGMFGYYFSGDPNDPCQRKGIVLEKVRIMCEVAPQNCVTYDKGLFTNRRFIVSDYADSPRIDRGGGAYDQGWSTVFLLDLYQLLEPGDLREDIYRSIRLSFRWSRESALVANSNYTAKLVWLLARGYAITGERELRDAALDKSLKAIIPAMLSDFQSKGYVDGLPSVKLSSLHPLAQTPGRFWDPHNALAAYQSINIVALIELSAALLERGDEVELSKIEPFMLISLRNLIRELRTFGIESYGSSEIPYAPLYALLRLRHSRHYTSLGLQELALSIWSDFLSKHSAPDNLYSLAMLIKYAMAN